MEVAIHVSVVVPNSWSADKLLSVHNRVLAPLRDSFAGYYRRSPGPGGLEFRAPDFSVVEKLHHAVEQSGCNYQVVSYGIWSTQEIVRARWVPLPTDVSRERNAPNEYPIVFCPECSWFDETKVPAPYRIANGPEVRRHEMLSCYNGLIAVTSRVRELLLRAVPDQIEWGPVEVTERANSLVNVAAVESEWSWVRPKHLIGANVVSIVKSSCPRCGVPVEYKDPVTPFRKTVHCDRTLVEHFGDPSWDIASLGNWRGSRRGHAILRQVVLSGGLFAYLFNHKVKGLYLPEQGIYSAKDEPCIEPQRRFDIFLRKEDRVLRQKMFWQRQEAEAAKLESLTPEEYLQQDKGVAGHVFRSLHKRADTILYELNPFAKVHIDVHVFHPAPQRDFYTLITEGLSSQSMNVPKGGDVPKYAELLLCLPPSWKIAVGPGQEDPCFSWPFSWLGRLAHHPSEGDTFVAANRVIPNDDSAQPFAPNTKLCCWLLRKPRTLPEGFDVLQKTKKKRIHFYAMVAIHEDEMRLHLEKGPRALEELLERFQITELLDIDRPSVVGRER